MEEKIQLIHVRDAAFAELPAIQQLYETAFPAPERRRFEDLLQLLPEPQMHLHAISVAGKLAGLAVHWQLDGFLYLEHLAIVPEYKGLGYGRSFMQWLLKQPQQRFVLEVERPATEEARKRIQFYEKLGLTLHNNFDYLQPPYQRHGKPVPLYLMARPAIATAAAYERITDCIREQVYERFYA